MLRYVLESILRGLISLLWTYIVIEGKNVLKFRVNYYTNRKIVMSEYSKLEDLQYNSIKYE